MYNRIKQDGKKREFGDHMNNPLVLVSTRFKMPQPRKNYIVRQELFSKLETMSDYQVTLIKSGAGTGKTTLLTSFIKEKKIEGIQWISLDKDCNNVFLFWNYVIEALGTYLESEKQGFVHLYKSNFQKSNIEQLLVTLINALHKQEDIYIVLDDFHYIKDDFLLQTIDFFLRNISDNVHLILLSRQEPELYLASLNMAGKLLVIDEQELKLSKPLSEEFLTRTLNLAIDQETQTLMNRLAEGWVGGLQLIATVVHMKKEKHINSLNLSNTLIADYVTKEIYESLNDEEKKLLVITSIVPYFNEAMCQWLIEGIDFRNLLERLLKKNIMIICMDEEKNIYRYHNLLREYLQTIFKGLSQGTQKYYHLKAADFFKALKTYDHCLDQCLLAEDYLTAMEIIVQSPTNMTLLSYGDNIPESFIIKNPDFAYQSFFYHYINMDFEKCQALYKVVEENTQEDSVFLPFQYLNVLTEKDLKLEKSHTLSVEQVDELKIKNTTKALILIKEASILHNQSQYNESLECIEKALSYTMNHKNPYILFYVASIKSQILEEMGELSKCEALYDDMEAIVSSNTYITMFNISFYAGNAGVQLKKMDLDKAKECLNKAKGYIVDKAPQTTLGYQYNLAEYKFLMQEEKEGLSIVEKLMTIPTFHNLIYMSSLLQYVFRINQFSGELVERFIEQYNALDEKDRPLESQLLYVNILFHNGQLEDAIKHIDEILKYCRMNKIKFVLVQGCLSKINMLSAQDANKREIMNLFREALYYSSEDKIRQPFYLEKEVVHNIINQYGVEITKGLNFKEQELYEAIVNRCQVKTKTILSNREIEVIKELAKGSKNKEIADTLCISLATVKSHTINIYSKLQVNNRTAAVREAEKLKLL
ncbi:LuxR family maltose regulon positive regulatory protein [Natranaerovirga hydrolytica]|uniref:LuxR family maltose regulon positive regulatory protein n=2 Tax=Natranaerovirga hydrolytica TaxID=680378 RepID=A0A4R1MJM1_9FIRM|nr:LuxR family maltose regulon positive regulatory protein [Natranaerovirga hydrolytica]